VHRWNRSAQARVVARPACRPHPKTRSVRFRSRRLSGRCPPGTAPVCVGFPAPVSPRRPRSRDCGQQGLRVQAHNPGKGQGKGLSYFSFRTNDGFGTSSLDVVQGRPATHRYTSASHWKRGFCEEAKSRVSARDSWYLAAAHTGDPRQRVMQGELTGAEWENVTRHAHMRVAASVPKELPPVVAMGLFDIVAVGPP